MLSRRVPVQTLAILGGLALLLAQLGSPLLSVDPAQAAPAAPQPSRSIEVSKPLPREAPHGLAVARAAEPVATSTATATPSPVPTMTPTSVPSLGATWSWGDNAYGQLGDGTSGNVRYSPVLVSDVVGMRAMAGGSAHSLALSPRFLSTGGAVWAWGDNSYGQLGDGTTVISRSTPVQASGPTSVAAIAAGAYYSLALTHDGTVWDWGDNTYGQLGDGSSTSRSTPDKVTGVTGVTAIAAGWYHSLALKPGGTVWAWGKNDVGQLGTSTTETCGAWPGSACGRTPVQVTSLAGLVVTAISGGGQHTLTILSAASIPTLTPTPLPSPGVAWSWGDNNNGQLGDGTYGYGADRLSPVQVSNPSASSGQALSGVATVTGGSQHSLALRSDGTVWAWGDSYYGQIGDGTFVDRHTPVQVSSLTGVVAIAAGEFHSLALKDDGTVWAWGRGEQGQLGDGFTATRTAPVRVSGLAGVVAIAAGANHSLALRSDGTL
ncbi:MAG: hypothetical protein HY690_10285 [Chloroflexi bacterium]|nr:hypothetical protein [Chloroflexota bacterium]